MAQTIELYGAKGGQGTTTVAAVLAVFCAGHRPTALVSHEPDTTAAALGLPWPTGSADLSVTPTLRLVAADGPLPAEPVVIIDRGRGEPVSGVDVDRRYAVVRGPCYLALARLVRSSPRIDGVILVRESGRSLDVADVEAALGTRVVVTIEATAHMARSIDAGLLLSTLHRLQEFAALRRLAAELVGEAGS